jgi:protein-tyrosine phosphatase
MTSSKQKLRSTNSSNSISPFNSFNMADTIRGNVTFFDLQNEKTGLTIRVCISPSPTESSIQPYVEFMVLEKITDLFNLCDANENDTPYDCSFIQDNDISVHHFPVQDGQCPDPALLSEFNKIINNLIESNNNDGDINILFHCQAGLGRAPALLAYLMMSRFGWKSKRLELIENIRSKRRASFNHSQLNWVQDVKVKKIKYPNNNNSGCIIV